MAPSRRADHCALISEMRASLRDQASAWIWEREFARGRARELAHRCDGVWCGALCASAVPLLSPRVVVPFF